MQGFGHSYGVVPCLEVKLKMTSEQAIKAIIARIQGVYDEPNLVSFGPLSTNRLQDILDIAKSVKP
jgi:malonyl CoA-acyl carrier protein transacylase